MVAIQIRDFLCSRGVYVKKGHGTKIAKELIVVIKEDILWPEDDPNRPIAAKPPIISRAMPVLD